MTDETHSHPEPTRHENGIGPPPRYRAWLLRCWQEHGSRDDGRVWRYSLEDTHTGERRSFVDLPALIAALEREELRDLATSAGASGPAAGNTESE